MVKTLVVEKRPVKQMPRVTLPPQVRLADEFDADIQEDRSVPVLADRRRQFLAGLGTRATEAPEEN